MGEYKINSNLNNNFAEEEFEDTIWVVFNDCVIADYISKNIPKCIVEYTVEINPPNLVESPVKSVMYHTVPDFSLAVLNSGDKSNCVCEEDGINVSRGKTSTCNTSPASELEKKFKYKVCNNTRLYKVSNTRFKYKVE